MRGRGERGLSTYSAHAPQNQSAPGGSGAQCHDAHSCPVPAHRPRDEGPRHMVALHQFPPLELLNGSAGLSLQSASNSVVSRGPSLQQPGCFHCRLTATALPT